LVDTSSTPMLLKILAAKKIVPSKLFTHHFKLDEILAAYDTFRNAAETLALKVIIEA
jgi:alcohol dehydrogenase